MKFKVGDKVRVREWDSMKKEFGIDDNGSIMTPIFTVVRDMKQFCGNIYTVIKIYNNFYMLDCCKYYFTDDMLLNVSGGFTFAKSDLKTGMTVETRDHGVYLVFGNRLIDIFEYKLLSNYSDVSAK